MENFQVLFWHLFLVWFHCGQRIHPNDFIPFKFAQIGLCCTAIWKEGTFWCCCMGVNQTSSVVELPLLIFYLVILPTADWGASMYPVIVGLSTSPFSSNSFCFMDIEALLFDVHKLGNYNENTTYQICGMQLKQW